MISPHNVVQLIIITPNAITITSFASVVHPIVVFPAFSSSITWLPSVSSCRAIFGILCLRCDSKVQQHPQENGTTLISLRITGSDKPRNKWYQRIFLTVGVYNKSSPSELTGAYNCAGNIQGNLDQRDCVSFAMHRVGWVKNTLLLLVARVLRWV